MRVKTYQNGGYLKGGFTSGGGEMTGPLFLAADPIQDLEAVTKQYADGKLASFDASKFASGTLQVGRLPAFTGDLTSNPGSNVLNLIDTGIGSGSYSKVSVNSKGLVIGGGGLSESDLPDLDWSKVNSGLPTTFAGYGITDGLAKSGGTVTGYLTLNADPSDAMHLATKQYVDNIGNDIVSLKVGDMISKNTSVTPAGFLKCNGGQVARATYPALYAVVSDLNTINVDYVNYSALGSGQPWRQQYDINDSQNSNLTNWTSNSPLPGKLGVSQAIVTKNRVYLLGGYNGSGLSIVYTAPINSDGTLGTWTTGTSLPGILYWSQVAVTKNRVYLISGYNGTSWTSIIYTAPINSDGTLGTWSIATSLPGVLGQSQVLVTKNRIYLLGGFNGTSVVSTVYTAPINEDGTIGAWTTGSSLPGPLAISQAIVTKNRVYLLSGGVAGGVWTSAVYTAPINADGTLGAWVTDTSLPFSLDASTSIVVKNRVYIFAGYNNTGPISTIYTAPINSDGTLGGWTSDTSLPVNLGNSQAIVVKNKIYLLGGQNANGFRSNVYSATISDGLNDYSKFYDGVINKFDGSDITGLYNIYQNNDSFTQPGNGKPWQQQYQINTQQSTDITGWTAGTSLPIAVFSSVAIVTKNRAYIFGGNDGVNMISSSYTAPINSDGTLGTWTAASNIPGPIAHSQAIVTKNRVYLLGGSDVSAYTTDAIYTAPINSDGTLGTWTVAATLPTSLGWTEAIITKSRVYLLGGNIGEGVETPTSTIYTAPINTDGTLGAWSTFGNLPIAINRIQSVVTKNRVYLLGGYDGTNTVNTVYTAPINEDGTLGAWTTSTPLPTVLALSQVYTTKNRVYLIGGVTAITNGNISNVYTAPINADGTLGTWTTGTALPGILGRSAVITTNSRIYTLGGTVNDSTPVSTVYTALISGSLNNYSSYYDGTITPITPDNFRLPDTSLSELDSNTFTYIKY